MASLITKSKTVLTDFEDNMDMIFGDIIDSIRCLECLNGYHFNTPDMFFKLLALKSLILNVAKYRCDGIDNTLCFEKYLIQTGLSPMAITSTLDIQKIKEDRKSVV